MKKKIEFSDFKDFADNTNRSIFKGNNAIDKYTLRRLEEYNDILSLVKDTDNNIYILLYSPDYNILIPCTSADESRSITKSLILNYEYYRRYGKDKINTKSKQSVEILVEKDYISIKLKGIKQIIDKILSIYLSTYKRTLL